MVSFNNYSLRNMPSVHYGRMNVWARHDAYAQGARDCFYRNVPPSLYSGNFIGFPGCGFPPIFCCPPAYPMGGFCSGIYGGFIAGNLFGQAIGSIAGAIKSIFSK